MSDKAILLVEDNPDDVILITRALRKGGVTNPIIEVGNGVEAVDYLYGTGKYEGRTQSDRPAVILLDLKLPQFGGLDVLKKLRNDPLMSQIPILVLTSSSEQYDIIRSYGYGADGYIRKPVDYDDFDLSSVSFIRRLGAE